MNFNSILEELNKLYEEDETKKAKAACTEELTKTTPTVKAYTRDEARAIIEADVALTVEYEELLPDYEDGNIDHSFEYGNFFNLIEDKKRIVIQWVISDACTTELIVDSLEQAIVAIRDIEASNGTLIGSETCVDEEEVAEEPVEENLGAALAVGAGALAGTAIGNLISESADDEEEIEFAEEPVATIEGEGAAVEETRQLILECSKCGAVVIKDEADVVIDEDSDLVNVEEECQYCEETEGYKIIGVVAPYEAVEEEPVEEEIPEEVIDEEPVEENLNTEKLPEEDEDLDEFLNANIKVDARGFGGSGNAVDII